MHVSHAVDFWSTFDQDSIPVLTRMQYPTKELDRQVDDSVVGEEGCTSGAIDFISRLSSETWEVCETGVWRGKADQLYI